MTDNVVWQLLLELRDGKRRAFAMLMKDAGVADAPKPGCYGWQAGPGARAVRIALAHAGDPASQVCWAGDWATAERHLAAIQPGLAAKVLKLARPANLASFGAERDAVVDSDLSKADHVDPPVRPKRAGRRQPNAVVVPLSPRHARQRSAAM